MINLFINTQSNERLELIKLLQEFNSSINILDNNDSELYFELNDTDLIIHHIEIGNISVSSLYQAINIRYQKSSHELIVQTIKPKKVVDELLIWDLTGGLGLDSVLMSSLGYPVTLVEQNMTLAFILHYASITRLIPHNIKVVWANSLEYLDRDVASPHIIYLDPMFKDHKSAKSKKNMQLIQLLVDNDPQDDKLLFSKSINKALDKVVVKRDNKQAVINDEYKVSYNKLGKTVRYDVYQVIKPL